MLASPTRLNDTVQTFMNNLNQIIKINGTIEAWKFATQKTNYNLRKKFIGQAEGL